MRVKKLPIGKCLVNSRSRRRGRRRDVVLHLEALEDRRALTALPPGFRETLITTSSDLSGPTAMEFSPTGQLWVLEQGGRAKLVRNDGTTHTALTLTVDSAGERGLLGIAFDPTYDGAGPNTDFVYLYYTTPRASTTDPSNNRVSRFVVTGAGTTTPTLGSELLLRELPPENEDGILETDGNTNHNGGAIHFGPDGKLYVAVGDHNYDNATQSLDVAQTKDTPFGKILRINADGTNPSDNPFFTGSTTDWPGAIWALGLRNPYTFAFQPVTGKLFINDVGENTWEEINEGQAGANYGWAGWTGVAAPLWEGFESPPPPWADYHDPVMAYDHSSSLPSPAGAAITGGVFYPANSRFGSAYAGKYFFADFGGNFIRVFDPAVPGSVNTPDTSTSFASSLTTGGPVDLKVDSAGNLYYLARGGTGEIYRISLTEVVGRRLFYNQSGTGPTGNLRYDGNNAAINSRDDNAIATDKVAYLPGAGPATFANMSNYSKGINGIMIDLVGPHGTIAADDFVFRVGNNNTPSSWTTATAPASVSVRAGAGVNGSDRVEIIWANGAIMKQWLEVIMLANADTGLAQKPGYPTGQGDVFFFGSAVGDSGQGDTTTMATVDVTDELAARNHPDVLFHNIPITNLYDYNRDARVDVTDQLIARNNATDPTSATRFLNIGSPPSAPEGSSLAAANDDDASMPSAFAMTSSGTSDTVASRWPDPSPENFQTNRGPVARLLEHLARCGSPSSYAPMIQLHADQTADIGELDDLLVEDLLADLAQAIGPFADGLPFGD